MEKNKYEVDGEKEPIFTHEKSNGYNHGTYTYYKNIQNKIQNKIRNKKYVIIFTISLLMIILLFKLNSKYNTMKESLEKIDKRVEELESQLSDLVDNVYNRKLGIAIVCQSLFGNGIGRYLTVLSELLSKTEKYDVYLIVEESSIYDFPCYKDVKKVVQKKDEKEVVDWDRAHNIDIYILNNDISNYLEAYKSLGKKVIGIFHGVFYSCIFTNDTYIYQQWYRFKYFDAFIQIIPDDYYIYKRSEIDNEVFIPNLYTFEHSETPISSLETKNVLIVGRIDDIIKGAEFGIKAFAETLKQVPDAKLNIVSHFYPDNIKNLVNELGIGENVYFLGSSQNISEQYLDSSVLIVSSLSESFPMVMNEAKAHGLPVVAFNVDYSPCFQKGVITVEMFDYKAMGNEVAKLLKDFNYRKKKGLEAKYSLDMFKNNETIIMWKELFKALMKGKKEFQKFQKKVEDKYYNEKLAKYRLEKHYKYAQQFNKIVSCHSFEKFIDLNFLKTFKECQINEEMRDIR